MAVTYNFKTEDYDYSYPVEAYGEFRDMRNGIICRNPSLNWDCYFNYLTLLNDMRTYWKNFGYLDLGMMPVLMAPHFMQEGLLPIVRDKLYELNIKAYNMKPVSLMYDRCKLSVEDIWVFREDAATVMGRLNGRVTAEQFLRWCFQL